jgi:hypothetical protein
VQVVFWGECSAPGGEKENWTGLIDIVIPDQGRPADRRMRGATNLRVWSRMSWRIRHNLWIGEDQRGAGREGDWIILTVSSAILGMKGGEGIDCHRKC